MPLARHEQGRDDGPTGGYWFAMKVPGTGRSPVLCAADYQAPGARTLRLHSVARRPLASQPGPRTPRGLASLSAESAAFSVPVALARRGPRWESGAGERPRPRQIGDGDDKSGYISGELASGPEKGI